MPSVAVREPRAARRDPKMIAVGDVFYRWTVIGSMQLIPASGPTTFSRHGFLCRCECGTERVVPFSSLGKQSGSCGCLQRDWALANVKHGRSNDLGFKRQQYLQRMYGLSPEAWDVLYDQQLGRCAVCLLPLAEVPRICVDHDHLSGEVRGLLCHACNVGLGFFRDDLTVLERAVAYLNRSNTSAGTSAPTLER